MALLRAMLAEGLLTDVAGGCVVSTAGTQRLEELGVALPAATGPTPAFAPCHPDWRKTRTTWPAPSPRR